VDHWSYVMAKESGPQFNQSEHSVPNEMYLSFPPYCASCLLRPLSDRTRRNTRNFAGRCAERCLAFEECETLLDGILHITLLDWETSTGESIMYDTPMESNYFILQVLPIPLSPKAST
jgi:hypothetical protein